MRTALISALCCGALLGLALAPEVAQASETAKKPVAQKSVANKPATKTATKSKAKATPTASRSKGTAKKAGAAAATAGAGAAVAAQNPGRLAVHSGAALVVEQGGEVAYYQKNANAVMPIASITKLMTAMVVLDAGLDPDEQLRIVRADGDSSLQRHSLLADGVAVSRGALLQLALLPSENRAAAALARTYPGGSAAFHQALQAKIHSLGLVRTTLTDPVGSSPANTSTASEVAKIVAAAARYPDIARITSHPQASVAVNGKTRTLHNTNPLVGGKGWDILLSKTGSSHEAGSCLTMRMRSGGKHVTVVLLDADGAQRRSLDAGHIRDTLADRTGRM